MLQMLPLRPRTSNTLAPLVSAALLMAGTPASAQNYAGASEGFLPSSGYVEIVGGYSVSDDTSDIDGGLASIAVGQKFKGFRYELEFAYRGVEGENQIFGVDVDEDINAFSLLTNAFLDFEVTDSVELFVGGGIGATYLDLEGSVGTFSVDDDDVAFTWQVEAGVAVRVAERAKLTLGYSYATAVDVDFDGFDLGDLDTHNVFAGVRFSF